MNEKITIEKKETKKKTLTLTTKSTRDGRI